METQLEMVQVRPLNPELLNISHIESWVNTPVVDGPSEKLCGERMNLLYEHRKKLEADRDSIVKPLRAAIKATDDLAKPILVPIATAYAAMNLRLGMYLSEKRKKEEDEKRKAQEAEAARLKAEADRKAQEAVDTNDVVKFDEAARDERIAALVQNAPVELKQRTEVSSGATFVPVTRWKARVVDFEKVPRMFLMVDEARLQRYATEMKDTGDVSGVQFYSETTTMRRTA